MCSFHSLKSYFPSHINHEKLLFSTISLHITRNIASYHFCFKAIKNYPTLKNPQLVRKRIQRTWLLRLFFTCLVLCHPDPFSIKDFLSQWLGICQRNPLRIGCKKPAQPQSCPVSGVRVGDTHWCENAPVQDTLKNYSNPEFPGGQLRLTLWPAKKPDFSLCLILLWVPIFHSGWSQGGAS